MARKKNSDFTDDNNVFDDIESEQSISEEIVDMPEIESESESEPDYEQSKPITKVCNIISLADNAVHIDFDGYGVAVEVKDVETYRSRKMIRVSYSGEIGTADFKVWVN